MKKQLIRQSVFETNSSSAHSISLGKDTGKQFLFDWIYPDQNGIITLTGGKFGWHWFKENDAVEKANYAAVASMNSDSFRETLIQVIKDQTGCDDVVFALSDDWDDDNYSYIDHESVGTCPTDYVGLKDFIFNKNSWLFGVNDNNEPHPEFYHVPEYKDGKIIIPEYKYKLIIEGFDKTSKFLTYPTNQDLEDAFESLLTGVYYQDGYFDEDNGIYAQIHPDHSRSFRYNSYYLPPNFDEQIIYFTNGLPPRIDNTISYEQRELERYDFFKKTAQAVKFSVNEI